MVVSVNKKEVQTVYVINDGTGQIECNLWLNESQKSSMKDNILANNFIRVVGQVKVFNGKRNINAFCVRKIEDNAEAKYHKLMVLAAYITRTKGEAAEKGKLSGKSSNNQKIPGTAQYKVSSLVKNILQAEQDEEFGMSISDICYRVCTEDNTITEHLVKNAIFDLCNQGLCYTTTDDDHIKFSGL